MMPSNRWSRFSLRTLFVFVSLGAAVAAVARIVLPIILADPSLYRRLELLKGGLLEATYIAMVAACVWGLSRRLGANPDGRTQYLSGCLTSAAWVLLWLAVAVIGATILLLPL